jgi:hypothetical protein
MLNAFSRHELRVLVPENWFQAPELIRGKKESFPRSNQADSIRGDILIT